MFFAPHPLFQACVSSTVLAFGRHQATRASFLEAFGSLGRKDATSAFRSLFGRALQTIEGEAYVPEALFEGGGEEAGEDVDARDVECDGRAEEHLRFLLCCAECVRAYMETNPTYYSKAPAQAMSAFVSKDVKKLTLEEASLGLMRSLHDNLVDFSKLFVQPATDLQLGVMGLCSSYLKAGYVDGPDVAINLLPLLLIKACDINSAESDVQAVHNLRSSFGLLDYSDPDTGVFKKFLMKAYAAPSFLRSDVGVSFLVHLFEVDESLIGDVGDAVRRQLLDGGEARCRTYGEIYLRAWKACEGDLEGGDRRRRAIEDTCLLPMMEASMAVANLDLARNVRACLSPLHESKKDPTVDALLHRSYSPVLYRNLNAASGHVRLLTCGILADTFPLHDPAAKAKDKIATIDRGVQAMSSLLVDRDAKVRVEAGRTVSRVLGYMWDLLPVKDVRGLLNVMVTQQACDASSPQVRAGAVKVREGERE